MPHQRLGLAYLDENSGGPLLMEMRLGKTLTAIRYIKYRLRFPCLIVSPYSVMYEWASQLSEDGESHYVVLDGGRQQRLSLLNETKRWYISNYESAKKLALHTAKEWKSVILDESIRIANPKAKITLYMLNNFKQVPAKMILCGNPCPENELQLVTQFIFTQGNFMGFRNYWGFRAKNYTNVGYDWIPKGNLKQSIRDYVKKHAFILSRKDAGMGSKKIYETRTVKMNEEQLKQIDSIKYDFEYGDKEVKNALGQLISYSYIAGGLSCEDEHKVINDAKMKELYSLIKGELNTHKIIVWCRFRAEQDAISDFLMSKNELYIKINGDVSPENRKRLKTNWQSSSFINIALLTIKSCSKGLDWSAADTAIYYSNEFSNDERSQSEDRIIDVRKNVPLLYVDLVSENSVDLEVLKALKSKSFDSAMVMNDYMKRLGVK